MTTPLTLGPTISGNTETFYGTGMSSAGVPEDVTGNTITFRAWDSDGNEIVKTTADDITLYTQSGATLGKYAIPIVPADYPAAWIAITYGPTKRVFTAIQRDIAGVIRETRTGVWLIEGQGIA
jgi:hypothetical protein